MFYEDPAILFAYVVALAVMLVVGYAVLQFFIWLAAFFGVSLWVVTGGFFVLSSLLGADLYWR